MRRLNARWVAVFVVAVAIAVLWIPASALAQTAPKPETLAGKYQGSATMPDGSSMPLSVDLRLEKGMLIGTGDSGQGVFTITGSKIEGDKITMSMDFQGMAGALTGVVKGGNLEGTWVLGEMSGGYTLTKGAADAKPAAPAANTPVADPPAAAAGTNKPAGAAASATDPLTGTWDGVTGQGDQAIGFVLTLKLAGDKVTGDVSSDQGGAQLSTGTWKDGALTVTFEIASTTATMVGAMKDGKLVGTIDLGGQMQMPWAAVKRGTQN